MKSDYILYYDVTHNVVSIINKIKLMCGIQHNNINIKYRPYNNEGWVSTIQSINNDFNLDIPIDHSDLILTYKEDSTPKVLLGVESVLVELGVK